MTSKQLISTSKFLSLVLRHKPETIGIELDEQGWVAIEELFARSAAHGRAIERDLLEHVVATSDKQRFAISSDGVRIRANQGHSIAVDLRLPPTAPPARLYHGTVARFSESIRQAGLLRGNRQHVHLSAELETAKRVGNRHGVAVILVIRCDEMVAAQREFYLSQNSVWLTDHVPAEFIDFPND